jgi:hypothetical protein
LPGVNLRNGNWQVETKPDEVTFRRPLPKWNLEVVKTYRLEKVPTAAQRDASYPGYDLRVSVAIRNTDKQAHTVSYQLDGPTGLPKEGYWYASKVNGTLRDVVVSFNKSAARFVSSETIAADKEPAPWEGEPISYIGVDAQYFSSVLIPEKDRVGDLWFQRAQAIRVGEVDPEWTKNVNTSCRLVSTSRELKPGHEIEQQYRLFAGPKRPALLAKYGIDGLVDYGWFHVVAVPMVEMLHFFYAVFRNYGIAIILLTAVVRLCMFPLSRKQALGAQKMQELQPQIKKLAEKYKNDPQARTKAQQELFQKHNYNPLSGCLVVFIQLPIFVALYRSLMFEPRGPRHALRLAMDDARLDQQRGGHVRPRPVLQHPADRDHCVVPVAAEEDDAPADRRAVCNAAEDHEVHDGLHGHHVLQGGGRPVHLLHRLEPVGHGRTQVPPQVLASRRPARRGRHAAREAVAG